MFLDASEAEPPLGESFLGELVGRRLPFLTDRIDRHLMRARERELRKLGTDTPTLDVLSTLLRSGAPYRLRTSEIEAASQVTASAITRRLDRLQTRGLVSRERDRHDKRVIHVRLTSKGHELIDGIVAGLTDKESGLLTPFSQRERETLERLLTRWLSWLENERPDRRKYRDQHMTKPRTSQ
jgi:DNA-binding MarR family transcriptional regulator